MNATLDLVPAYPELFLAISGMLFLMIGVFRKTDSTGMITWLSVIAMICTAALVLAAPQDQVKAFNGMFIVNSFTSYAKVLTLVGAAISLLLINSWVQKEQIARFELPIIVQFATLGMLMMISANDFISLYVGLELQSLALYVLASYHRNNLRSTEAGVKYFVLGALASGLLLYGSSLVYGFGGTTSFDGLATAMAAAPHGSVGVIIGIVFVISGMAFKVSAVPFHMWTPDVYEGAPTPITAFFSVAPKVAALALFLQVLAGPFAPLMAQWQQVVIFISVISMAWGAVAAIGQTNIKRLMAYSSIGHVGYALIGLAVGTSEGAAGMLFYMLVYIFMNLGTFAVILSMRVKGRAVEDIRDLAGIGKTNPGIALALATLMFSMAGIPPLAGFLAKYFIFLAAINSGLVGVAVFGLLTSVIGAYYYMRLIKIMYFDASVDAFDKPDGITGTVMFVCSAIVLLLFFVAGPFINHADAAAKALFLS